MEKCAVSSGRKYYIASCLFTARFPETSLKVQRYIKDRGDIETVRCCIPNFTVQQNTERIPDDTARAVWKSLPDSAALRPGDTVYSICHNCTNIADEQHPGIHVVSLWELIDRDEGFAFPDYGGMQVTVQDCWRTRERAAEQAAVRSLLHKMNIRYAELPENHGQTEFCGSTLYREQPAKNPAFAPKHYIEQAGGKFRSHSKEEQVAIMRDYCKGFATDTVVCYCHYCLEGLLEGGADGRHLAHLLFP